MIATKFNSDDNAFELSNTGVIWILYLLIIATFFFYFEPVSGKEKKVFLEIESYEKESDVFILSNKAGYKYRLNPQLLRTLIHNGFLKKESDTLVEVKYIDDIIVFTSIINRINALDRNFQKEINLQHERLNSIGEDIEWIKSKLGYEYTPIEL